MVHYAYNVADDIDMLAAAQSILPNILKGASNTSKFGHSTIGQHSTSCDVPAEENRSRIPRLAFEIFSKLQWKR